MLKISTYKPEYKKEIAELFTRSIHETCAKDYSKAQLEAWASLDIDYDSWGKRLDKTQPFLAFVGDSLAGFVEFYDDYIDCFYINPSYQKQGVGRALLNHIFDLAKNKKIDKIRVDASITAKPFFEKFGFIELKRNIVKRKNQELINFSMELSI